MIETKIFDKTEKPGKEQKSKIIEFLFRHLDEYGDPKPDISKAVSYALNEGMSFGGFILVASEEETIVGVVVINRTGMNGYIPDNILVYIATHRRYRGKGLGKRLMKETMEHAEGDIALHVEPENPARFLYERVGFRSKYLEMRFVRKTSATVTR